MSDWYSGAACADDVRFQEEPESVTLREEMREKCQTECPVAAQCLAAALLEERSKGPSDRFGIRGGMWSKERAALARAARRAPVDGRRTHRDVSPSTPLVRSRRRTPQGAATRDAA